ncbi:MAG: hypothetical protein UZ22_OP11002000953 [Microgenomates bacterium OLB23]|nr:MAG: hypothetical protein UZ22_OP11002000953 [Microgenomates bacterium OLB23]
MSPLFIVAMFLFIITAFLCVVVFVGRNEVLYKRFFAWWLTFWGVPETLQKNLPTEMYVRQAKILSWLFVFLAAVTFCTGILMLYLELYL